MSFKDEMLKRIGGLIIRLNDVDSYIPMTDDNKELIYRIINEPDFLDKVKEELDDQEDFGSSTRCYLSDESLRLIQILLCDVNLDEWEITNV
jgi:hypothetical protein